MHLNQFGDSATYWPLDLKSKNTHITRRFKPFVNHVHSLYTVLSATLVLVPVISAYSYIFSCFHEQAVILLTQDLF